MRGTAVMSHKIKDKTAYDSDRGQIEDHLSETFLNLYHHHADKETCLEALKQLIKKAQKDRPYWLKTIDEKRSKNPSWYLSSDQIGYSCYVDRFGGNLKAIHDHSPHLTRFGIRYLHLLPFWKRPEGDSDGGFAVSDHKAVHEEFGTLADLDHLARSLSDMGITLGADLVLNHMANTSLWAQKALEGDEKYKKYFHIFESKEECEQFDKSLTEIFPETAPGNFTFIENLGWVWTTFYPFQWDLNWHNPQVFVEIIDILLNLSNSGIGVFRLDSAPFLWKRQGTDCQNQPETHMILKIFRAVIELAAPSVLLKAEAVVPAQDLPAYFGLPHQAGSECHLAYHTGLMAASWAAICEQNVSYLKQVISTTPLLGTSGSWLLYIRCHDDIRWDVLRPDSAALGDPQGHKLDDMAKFLTNKIPGSFARGQAFESNGLVATNGMTASLVGIEAALSNQDDKLLKIAINRHILLYALIFSFGGMPVIYMGDEFGLMNAKNIPKGWDGRFLHRPYFDEEAASKIDDPKTLPGSIAIPLMRLAEKRRNIPELSSDSPTILVDSSEQALLAFTRGEDFLAIFNFSDQTVSYDDIIQKQKKSGTWRPIIHESGSDNSATLGAWQFCWLKRS